MAISRRAHEILNRSDLIEKRDLEGFQQLMHKHIERSKETCLRALEESNLKRNG